MTTRRRPLAAMVLAASLVLGACGGSDDSSSGPCRSGDEAAKASKPDVQTPNAKVQELETIDLIEGCGDPIPSGAVANVTVHYVGRSQANDVEFDSSWERNAPASFPVGAGSLIQGWDEGLVDMKEGGRRELTIPGSLAYGPAGRPPNIGPDDTLRFVIDLVSVQN